MITIKLRDHFFIYNYVTVIRKEFGFLNFKPPLLTQTKLYFSFQW